MLLYTSFNNQADGLPGFVAVGPGDEHWSSVVLLVGFDGADAATSAVDESPSAHVLTFLNNAQLDTAQTKFGASSLLLDGANDAVTAPDSADWHFGAGAFTIECFYRPNATHTFGQVVGHWQSSDNNRSWALFHTTGGNLEFWTSSDGVAAAAKLDSAAGDLVAGTWYHVCVDYDGTTYRLYVDGVVKDTDTSAITLFDAAVPLSIGATPDVANDLNGWVDEVRITKGVARYAGAFTPPVELFPRHAALTVDDYEVVNLGPGTEIVARGSSIEFDDRIREIGNVIHDPDGPGQAYKLVYTGYQGAYDGNDTFVGYAQSPDGLNWTKVGKLTLGADRAAEDPYLVKDGSTYYLYVEDKADVPFRNIRLYTSTDFSTWADQGDVLDRGVGGWDGQDVSSPVVWVEGATWHMLYEGRGTDQAGAVGHATSADGSTWTKDPGNPVLVGQNATFSFAGPISWSDAVVPDDIAKIGSTYVLAMHGRKIAGDTFYFRAGIATSTDLATWTDALAGDQVYTIAAPDATVMFMPTSEGLRHIYVAPGGGVMASQESAGDPDWDAVVLYVTGYEYDATDRAYDLSGSWHTLVTHGGAQIDEAQSNLGPSSMLFDGLADYFQVADHADWALATAADSEFFMEAFVRPDATKVQDIFTHWNTTGGQAGFLLQLGASNKLKFFWSHDGSTTNSMVDPGAAVPTGAWTHVAVRRTSDGTLSLMKNGVEVASSTTNTTIFDSNEDLFIGSFRGGSSHFDGWMELLRITKGASRHAGNFTPPAEPYPIGPAGS